MYKENLEHLEQKVEKKNQQSYQTDLDKKKDD